MREIIQVKYGIQVYIAEKGLEYEIEDKDQQGPFESEEEKLQAQRDKIEDAKFAAESSAFWKARTEKGTLLTSTYTIDKASIKYERNQNQEPEEFIRILPETGVMQHFFQEDKTNKCKMNTLNLHHDPVSSDWEINYTIEERKTAKKMILGYECYQLNIQEVRINEINNWRINQRYELYVTDEIPLPVRLLIPLWEPVTELCALEIKTLNMDHPDSFSVQRAIEIKKGIGASEMMLPEAYVALLTG